MRHLEYGLYAIDTQLYLLIPSEKLDLEKKLLLPLTAPTPYPREVNFGQAECIPKHSGARASDIMKHVRQMIKLYFL